MSKKPKYIKVIGKNGAEIEIPAGLKEPFLKNGYKLKKGGNDGK